MRSTRCWVSGRSRGLGSPASRVIARRAATTQSPAAGDCFVASLLAMTRAGMNEAGGDRAGVSQLFTRRGESRRRLRLGRVGRPCLEDVPMNSRSGVLSLLTNRGIAMKVGLGFACVLALLAFVSGEASRSFRAKAGFATYVQRVAEVGITRRTMDRSFLNLRRYVRVRVHRRRKQRRGRNQGTGITATAAATGPGRDQESGAPSSAGERRPQFRGLREDFTQVVARVANRRSWSKGRSIPWTSLCKGFRCAHRRRQQGGKRKVRDLRSRRPEAPDGRAGQRQQAARTA